MESLSLERLLILAGPEKGKTFLLRRIVQHFHPGGTIFDPLDEFGDVAGPRWNRITIPWPDLTVEEDGELSADLSFAMEDLESLKSGQAVLFNEGHRWIPNAPFNKNPTLKFLETARNRGVRFGVESKRPVMLPPLITDLVQTLLYKNFRGPRSRAWLTGAGMEPDLPRIELERWYAMRESGDEIWKVDPEQVARHFGSKFSLQSSTLVVD